MEMKFFFDIFSEFSTENAIIFKDQKVTYKELLELIFKWENKIKEWGILKGDVVALVGDFTPNTISILFALIRNNNIVIPLNYNKNSNFQKQLHIAGATIQITIDENENVTKKHFDINFTHEFYNTLRRSNNPGLVLFTSGTSGDPKAAVHDLTKLLEKFKTRKKTYRTLNFLLFDHWGGLNTMFHTLSNGGLVLAMNNRNPKDICAFIEKHKIELLPASPTFLNLLLLSEEYKNFDLSSLKLITYGTEPMPESTLKRINAFFPNIKLQQTYGLIELGVLRSKSKSNDSLWVKVGGEGFKTRVVEGLLEIKADSAMLGYLNAPSPFTEDGWFKTGDQVAVDGEYFRILGRKSEIINVGGEKVYPAEVESVIQEMSNVAEVTVFGEKNPIMGNVVCAKVRLNIFEERVDFIRRLKIYCKNKLKPFMIPVRIELDESAQHNERFKKRRN